MYTDTKDFREKAIQKFGNDIDSYLQEKKAIEEKEQKIKEAIEILKSNYDSDTISKILYYAIVSEHRTNQQIIIKNLFNALKLYSCSGSDDRNKEAVKWAKMSTEKETYFPCI